MKKILLCMVLLFFLATTHAFAGQQISFTKHPNLKLGFTTVIFAKCKMGPTVPNIMTFIDYAGDQGYAWIEIRDPDAVLTVEECRLLATYAKNKDVEIAYASNRGPLDADYWQVLGNAWRNAAVFKQGPGTVRVIDSNSEFMKDPKKMAWTEDEFKKAIAVQNSAAKGIKEQGLQLVMENANLPVKGKFGFEQYFGATDKVVGLQFDSANMFCVSKVRTNPKDAEKVFRKFAPRIYYVHLKSSVNGVAQPVLTDNELDIPMFLSVLAKNKKPYVAIELPQADTDTFEGQKANLQKSLDYLQRKGIIKIIKDK
jgi:sugar phosphate isomerase/epimerase